MQDEEHQLLMSSLVGHSVTGMLLVAFLDDVLGWEEREVLVQSITAIGPHVTAEQALQFLEETAHLLNDPQTDSERLLCGAKGLPSDCKVMLLALCTKVAFANGHLSDKEGQLLRNIADWIEIDYAGRETWKNNVSQALAEARERNSSFTGFENLF